MAEPENSFMWCAIMCDRKPPMCSNGMLGRFKRRLFVSLFVCFFLSCVRIIKLVWGSVLCPSS